MRYNQAREVRTRPRGVEDAGEGYWNLFSVFVITTSGGLCFIGIVSASIFNAVTLSFPILVIFSDKSSICSSCAVILFGPPIMPRRVLRRDHPNTKISLKL